MRFVVVVCVCVCGARMGTLIDQADDTSPAIDARLYHSIAAHRSGWLVVCDSRF